MACHNLCEHRIPPPKLQSLLGLGLNFCLHPFTSTPRATINESIARFRRDINVKFFFSGSQDDWDPTELFIRSEWEPDRDNLPADFRSRVSYFLRHLQQSFYRRRRGPSNLLPYPQYLLRALRECEDLIVVPYDNNLGPAIMERLQCIHRILLQDHLCDESTYLRLLEQDAFTAIANVRSKIEALLADEQSAFSESDRTFLYRSIEVESPFAEFYALIKIHKDPIATRPIINQSGSLLHGLGCWVDQQLQPLVRALHCYINSSASLKTKLETLQLQPGQHCKLFTMDARSMYTNIDITHALEVLNPYLRYSQHCYGADTILRALEIIMRSCYFRFGDSYFHQEDGTAMGAPPAPSFAMLYYGVHEHFTLLPTFQDCLAFYARCIDDGIGIWICDPDPALDATLWESFQAHTGFGKLVWDVSDRASTVNFLDMTITLLPSGRIKTRLYEKPLNLHLYLSPHSAHPPGLVSGLIHGMLYRILLLTTDRSDTYQDIRNFYSRLRNRGYARH
jgi:hypothetical protein